MSWLFSNNSKYYETIARASVDAINKSDEIINKMYTNVDWSLKHKLETKKCCTKAEEQRLQFINMQIESYEVQSKVMQSLAHSYNKMLPSELQAWW